MLRFIKRFKWALLCILVVLIWPMGNLFPGNYSTVILDRNKTLLRLALGSDGQYRFPPSETELPDKYIKALIAWEDKRYLKHPGVDPIALLRAAYQNSKSGERQSGGSTIPMQVARLANPKKRTYINKIREIIQAIKIDLHFSKDEILKIYADHVPMGRNYVGINTASYCYLGKPAIELTWAEAALFSVLPNSPALINLESDRLSLVRKRNILLERLYDIEIIDETTLRLAKDEPLPPPKPVLPFEAPHFTQLLLSEGNTNIVHSTLDLEMQHHVETIVSVHHSYLKSRGILNLAVLVAETPTGRIRSYIGSQDFYDEEAMGQVDGIIARRSTGSLLKPFLAIKALDRGPYTFSSLIQDVPTSYGTFVPQNASCTFSGVVTMEELLVQSLNVPSVRLLNAIGVSDFHDFLVEMGLRGFFRGPEGYGLTLILGGAEASLNELVQLYLTMGNMGAITPTCYLETDMINQIERNNRVFSSGAAYLTLKTLQNLDRPGSEYYWKNFSYQIPASWKTGTSYGQKDGWAIGTTPEYTVGVWIGNFSGEGNVEIGGAKSAGPLMFDILNSVIKSGGGHEFDKPEIELKYIQICSKSGFAPGPYCPDIIFTEAPIKSSQVGTCKFHQQYIVDDVSGYELCSLCWTKHDIKKHVAYILPSAAREIFMQTGRMAESMPLHQPGCSSIQTENTIEIVYPANDITIQVPRNYDGSYESIVLEANHSQKGAQLFWVLDQILIGKTTEDHRLVVDLEQGKHTLIIVDTEGASKSVTFVAFRHS